MTRLILLPLTILAFFLAGCQKETAINQTTEINFSDLTLSFSDTLNHSFTFTDKISGFWLGNSRQTNLSGHHGWTVNEFHYLKDYNLYYNNQLVSRSGISTFRLFPHQAERSYSSGLKETFSLLDSVQALILEIQLPEKDGLLRISPVFQNEVQTEFDILGKARRELIIPAARFSETTDPSLRWMGIRYVLTDEKNILVIFALEANLEPLQRLLNYLEKNYSSEIQKKKLRLENLLKEVPRLSSDVRYNRALAWARISMDALVTRQRGPGIWAGLPWFNNYWGRDTFISFPGALLINGDFAAAREILENFSLFQMKNPTDPHYGRIPNRITNEEVIYNTTDGTWWFIRSIYQYYLYSGDVAFIRKMMPVVRTALNGALKKRTDEQGFLRHGDAETWMDAVGPEGPWSPRGNRAVDVQALFYTSLQIGQIFAGLVPGTDADSALWAEAAGVLKNNFSAVFIKGDRSALHDHLNADGSADTTLRPNQIFALTVPRLPGLLPLLSAELSTTVSRLVTTRLTLPYGVLSISAQDKNFHPWHHYPPYYVPDAAYHNGNIWTWLAGPVIESLLAQGQVETAKEVILKEAEQILEYDAAGGFSELLEALPRTGADRPRISGTVTQAWNLAEYLRNYTEGLLGYQPFAGQDSLVLAPQFPAGWSEYKTRLPFAKGWIELNFIRNEQGISAELIPRGLANPLSGSVWFPGEIKPVNFRKLGNNGAWKYFSITPQVKNAPLPWPLLKPERKTSYPVLSQLKHQLLSASQITQPQAASGLKVISATDKLNDDTGSNGKYTYPRDKHFQPGIFDLESVEIKDLKQDWSFEIRLRNLTDPGWHPEYGFQLTFIALAFRLEGAGTEVQREVLLNSGEQLRPERAFNRLLLIGGGLEIRNAGHEPLAVFVPMQTTDRIGFVNERLIRFRLPKTLLPGLSEKSRITVLSGAQDDHGAAGIGEFREVRTESAAFYGGGASAVNPVNIYDRLEIN